MVPGCDTRPDDVATKGSLMHSLLLVASGAAALALTSCSIAQGSAPATASTKAPALSVQTVSSGPGQTVDVHITRPAQVRGAMLFSHGGGSEPSQYAALAAAFAREGWLVLSPLHRDSRAHPNRVDFASPAGFAARVPELEAAARLAGSLAPGKPLVAAGHSYGSLFAAMRGGALAGMGPPPSTPVRAVLALSSPGRIPGLINPGSYSGLRVPTMVVTGSADLVPGFVSDWRQHLAAFDDSPSGDKYALVVAAGTHDGVVDSAGPAFATARDFLAAYGLADAAARARLARATSTRAVELRRR